MKEKLEYFNQNSSSFIREADSERVVKPLILSENGNSNTITGQVLEITENEEQFSTFDIEENTFSSSSEVYANSFSGKFEVEASSTSIPKMSSPLHSAEANFYLPESFSSINSLIAPDQKLIPRMHSHSMKVPT